MSEAVKWGLGRRSATDRVHETLERLLDVLARGLVDVDTPALVTTHARIEELLAATQPP